MAIEHTQTVYIWKNTSTNEEFYSLERDIDLDSGIYDPNNLGKPKYFVTSVDQGQDAVFYNLDIDETPSIPSIPIVA